MPVERVARVGTRRFAVTGEIEHEDAARARERGGDGEPGAMRIAEAVQEDERAAAPELGPVKVHVLDAHEVASGNDGSDGIDRHHE